MIKNKALKFAVLTLCLSGCSSVSGMFGSKKEETKLEGERISVLELQRSLSPDFTLEDGTTFTFPEPWLNEAWPQAGGYPNHAMYNLSLSGEGTKRLWSTSIGRGSTDELPLNAQPVIANNMIFTLDTNLSLSAFNLENGRRVWRTDVENENEDEEVISGGIAYAHGMLYVTNGYDEVLAVDHASGDIVWRKHLPAPSRAAPTVLNGRVYVTTIDSRLVTLSAKDGTGLWEYTGISETTGLLGAASAGANSDIVVPVFSSGEITALRVENGSVAWSDNLASVQRFGGGLGSLSDIKAMPIVDRGIIIAISYSGKMVAIDERTGTRIWQKEISGLQTPWVSGNLVFILSSDNQLIALNIMNGGIFWIKQLQQFEDEDDKEDPILWSSPIMADGELILAGSHGRLVRVNANNGDVIEFVKTGLNVQIAPIIANDTLYLLSENGKLSAYK